MLQTRTARSATARRGRPVNPSCRGGASSMLRLTQAASQRLPSSIDLGEWLGRATCAPMPVTGPLAWES